MRKFNEICKSVENMDVLTYSAVLAKKSLEILPALNEITEDEIDAKEDIITVCLLICAIDGNISAKEKNWIKQLID